MKREERSFPVPLLQEESLQGRMVYGHPKLTILEDSIAGRQAGHRGEVTLDYYLRFLPHKEYHIIRGVRLVIYGEPCQIDTLVLTPRAAFIIEVKNISGELTFDEKTGQFYRKDENGRLQAFSNPLLQVDRHKIQFEKWLHFQRIFSYPIIPLVAISNPSTILNFPSGTTHKWRISHSEHIPSKIEQFEQDYSPRKVDFKWLEERLMEDHRPAFYNVLRNFRVQASELKLGVQCPSCLDFAMKRERYRWECLKCGHRSLNADAKAVGDYFLLLKSEITVQQCMKFLKLKDRYSAIRILKRLELKKVGGGKSTRYIRPNDIFGHLLNKSD